MTQQALAAVTGYSRSLIAELERNSRLPDVEAVIRIYVPALGLEEERHLAAQLVELAAQARGERPPVTGLQPKEEPYCMPVPPTGILGRDAEIRHLCDRLLGHPGRLLTLVGPPGVGKTRLAQAVGLELQAFYRDGACFISLAPVRDPALVASTLASALNVYVGSARSPQSRLIEHLRRKELLLVLDNFEQLVGNASPAVELVASLVAECPGLYLLVTSRERLHLRAEQRYQVEPLGLPAAVELFAERCRSVDAGFALTEALRPTIEAICELLDRLPLAIELCAAQSDLLSPGQLLERLSPNPLAATEDASGGRPARAIPESKTRRAGLQDDRLALLADGAQDLPPRQRTLHSAIAHSYDLLDDGERRLFRSLSVFAGGSALEAVEAVSGWDEPRTPELAFEDLVRGAPPRETTPTDSRTGGQLTGRPLLAALHALVGKSLVRAETTPDGERRYVLLEIIREYAWGQARAEGEEELLRRRHYAATLRLFRTADPYLRGPEATAWTARLEPEQENLEAALRRALDGGCYEDAAWLALAAAWFWFHVGRWQEASRWIVEISTHREALSAAQRLALLIDLHLVFNASADEPALDRYTGEMRELLEVCPDQALHASAWFMLGFRASDAAGAAAAWERSIAYARAAREEGGLPPTPRAAAEGVSGGRPAHELPASDTRPAGLYPEFGVVADGEFILATPMWAYADMLIEHGEFERAAPLLAESTSLFQARTGSFNMADTLGAAGRLALLQGDVARAHALLREAVTLGETLNYHWVLAAYQSSLGLATLYRGDNPEARRLLDASLHLCLDLNSEYFLTRVCTYLAETELWEGAPDAAHRWLAQSFAYVTSRPLGMIEQIERVMVAARVAAAQDAPLRAATLFGLADELRGRIHYELAGPARELADAALARARAALEPASFAEAFAAGHRLSLDEAAAMVTEVERGD
jgi:predicted ATPase